MSFSNRWFYHEFVLKLTVVGSLANMAVSLAVGLREGGGTEVIHGVEKGEEDGEAIIAPLWEHLPPPRLRETKAYNSVGVWPHFLNFMNSVL